jgi:trehalose-6-phosphate synthase
MPVHTLIRTISIQNSIAGEHKFEIYHEDNAMFYADIYKKNQDGLWVMVKDYYYFTKAQNIEDAVNSCIIYVDNWEVDLQTAKKL